MSQPGTQADLSYRPDVLSMQDLNRPISEVNSQEEMQDSWFDERSIQDRGSHLEPNNG